MAEENNELLQKSLEKYKSEGNSNELSQLFHDRAWETASDLNKQLLNLSTGSIAGLIYIAFNKREILIKDSQKNFLVITIILFGFAVLFTILGMQWDANRNYFLGQINDSTQQKNRTETEIKKRRYQKMQQRGKVWARIFFLLGILSAIIFLILLLY